jgi:hypothetical protein
LAVFSATFFSDFLLSWLLLMIMTPCRVDWCRRLVSASGYHHSALNCAKRQSNRHCGRLSRPEERTTKSPPRRASRGFTCRSRKRKSMLIDRSLNLRMGPHMRGDDSGRRPCYLRGASR